MKLTPEQRTLFLTLVEQEALNQGAHGLAIIARAETGQILPIMRALELFMERIVPDSQSTGG